VAGSRLLGTLNVWIYTNVDGTPNRDCLPPDHRYQVRGVRIKQVGHVLQTYQEPLGSLVILRSELLVLFGVCSKLVAKAVASTGQFPAVKLVPGQVVADHLIYEDRDAMAVGRVAWAGNPGGPVDRAGFPVELVLGQTVSFRQVLIALLTMSETSITEPCRT